MRLTTSAALAASLLGLAAALPSPAAAQAVAQANIVIVDMDRVVSDSAAGKDAQAQLKTRLDALRSRATTLRDQFGKEEQALIQARDTKTMAEDAWNAKVRELQTRRQSAETELRQSQGDYSRSEEFALKQINDAANPIVTAIMKEKGATIALAEGATLAHVASIDVTGEVIARLDRALPRVNVNPPAQAAAPAAGGQR